VLLDTAERHLDTELRANDLNPGIYAFWSCIIDSKRMGDLCRKLHIKPTVDLFYSIKAEKPTSLVDLAFQTLFLNRCSFSGLGRKPIGGDKQTSRWAVDCRYRPEILENSIQKAHKLLQGRTRVTNLPILDFLARLDGASIYLDPPYYHQGKHLYPTQMSIQEHETLARMLKKRRRWVLSYDDCSEVRALYSAFQVVSTSVRYSVTGRKRTNWVSNNELLISSL
jgi:DNA adenine methylase